MRRDNRSPIILSDKENIYPKRTNTGEYDTELVCAECEAIFSPWDDYANDLLLSDFEDNNYFIGKDGTKLAYIFKSTNYEKLKLFFLSVLWRASASKRDMFSRINLGPHEQIIKEMILNKDPGNPEDYSVFAARVGRNKERIAPKFQKTQCPLVITHYVNWPYSTLYEYVAREMVSLDWGGVGREGEVEYGER